jgi:hypothetical protein
LLTTAVAGNVDPVGTKVGWIGDNRHTCCASAFEVAVDIVDIDEGAPIARPTRLVLGGIGMTWRPELTFE